MKDSLVEVSGMLMTISLVLVEVTVPIAEDETGDDVVEFGKTAPTLVEERREGLGVVRMTEILLGDVPVEILLGPLAEEFHPQLCVYMKQTSYSQIVDVAGPLVEVLPDGAVERIDEDGVTGDPSVELVELILSP
jgi:hypothetical protein